MRYLSILFLFCCSFCYAQLTETCQTQGRTAANCNSIVTTTMASNPNVFAYCKPHATQGLFVYCSTMKCASPFVNDLAHPTICVCPEGQVEYNLDPAGASKTCGPVCTAPQIANTVVNGGVATVSCIDPPVDGGDDQNECEESEKVYDPVSGIKVCPGSGDTGSSSSTSSPQCVVPGDFDGDCVPDGDQTSSANNSTPTSSPDTGSSGSGGDDGGDNGGGGGGGGGDDGGSGSGGGGGGSSASNTSSGSNSSWTPNSGYGNWIPVDEGSNCPNKYRDNTGQWWCSGDSGANTSAAGQCDPTAENYWSCINKGSAGATSSVSTSASWSGGGECDDEPQCPAGDIECAQLLQQWHTRCGGEALDSKFFELEDEGEDQITFEKSLTNFKTELEKLPNTQIITEFFAFNGSGGCPVWRVSVWVFDVVIDQQCSPDIPWGVISGVIIAIAVLCAARIALT